MSRIRRSLASIAGLLQFGDPGSFVHTSSEIPTSGSPESESTTGQALPLAHRLAIVYLLLPVVVWLQGWFQWWLGIPAAALFVLALWQPLSGSCRVSVRPVTILLLAVAFAWTMTTAAGGVFDVQNFDWDKHRAILLDLGRGGWPTYLPAYFEAPLLLRYYLGYYMVPGLIASWFGAAALNWVVPVWTWGGVALFLLLFGRGLYGWKAAAAALLLIFFATLTVSFAAQEVQWARRMVVELMFSPQHLIAAALATLLVVQLRQESRFLAISGMLLGATMFWSPLVALGLLILLAFLLIENGIRPFFSWQNLLVAAPLFGLLIAYLSSGATTIPSGWIWEQYGWDAVELAFWMSNLVGFLVVGILVLLIRPALRHDLLFHACWVAPFLYLWYSFGLLNEYLRYALMPVFVLLSYYSARTVLTAWSEQQKWFQHIAFLGLIFLLALGAVGPLSKLTQFAPATDFRVLRYEELGTEFATVLNATGAESHDQYATLEIPDWFERLLRDSDAVRLQKGVLIIEAEYDVYLNGRELIYVRDPCSQEEVESRFILFVYPVNVDILEGREHDNLDFFFKWNGSRIGGVCIATVRLPDYEVDRFKTGQYIGVFLPTGVRWSVDYSMR